MKEYAANSLPLSMGNSRQPLRITVIKLCDAKELYDKIPDCVSHQTKTSCPCFRDGDSFVVTDKGGKPPANFPCQWAWHDMFQVVLNLQLGGNFENFKDGTALVSCTDGLHPVVFKLERLEQDT